MGNFFLGSAKTQSKAAALICSHVNESTGRKRKAGVDEDKKVTALGKGWRGRVDYDFQCSLFMILTYDVTAYTTSSM